MKKVLYVTTVSRTINAFLVPHIEMLLKEGYEVQCACSIDKPVNKGLTTTFYISNCQRQDHIVSITGFSN